MKFHIVNKKIVRNDILEKGRTMVIGLSARLINNNIDYSGSIIWGILNEEPKLYVEQCGIETMLCDWTATPSHQSGIVRLLNTTGYENDTNNTLIFAEEIKCQDQ